MTVEKLPSTIAEHLKPWFPQNFDFASIQIKSGGLLGLLFGAFGQSAVTWNKTINLTPKAKIKFKGNEILCEKREWTEEEVIMQTLWLIGHECWHVKQQKEMGWLRFFWSYVKDWLRHGGGRSNKLEQPANELADQILSSFKKNES